MEIKLLSCPLCLKPHFEGVDALRSSLINVATSHLSCPVCSESLLGLDKLTIHLFSHISNHVSEVKTPNNTIAIPPNEVIQIIEDTASNTEENIIAVQESMECKENETENEDVLVNEEYVQNKQLIFCDICNFCFNDETILEMHQKLLHQTTPDKKTGVYSYHCHLCSKKFKMKGSLMVHLRVAHYGFGHNNYDETNSQCTSLQNNSEIVNNESSTSADFSVNNEDIQESNLQNAVSLKAQDNKQWECDVCSKMFTTKYFLKKHKRLHTGEMPYYCAQCNKSFTFQQSYHKHMLYHSADKPHVCSECGRAFKELSTLHNHERIHSGERPFACETCGKCFRQRVSYLVHRRIHTGVMPYKCTACDKSFRYKVSQRSHKCPANPSGTVINHDSPEQSSPKAQDTIANQSTTSTEIFSSPEYSIKLLTGNMELGNVNVCASNEFVSNNFNVNVLCPAMEINTQNLQIVQQDQNTPVASEVQTTQSTSDQGFDRDARERLVPNSYMNDRHTDFYSMVLSPLLPDVQSLRLNGSVADDKEENLRLQQPEALKTINEESLKELLYGTSQNT